MVRKLQIRYIISAFLIVASILIIIITSLNINNYIKISSDADKVLNELYTSDGRLTDKPKYPFGPEAPFKTRFFIVELDSNGNVLDARFDKIASITLTDALEYAKIAKKESGKIDYYRYKVIKNDNSTTYIFLDYQNEYMNFYSFLKGSILISALGLLVFLVLIILCSFVVLRPTIESIKKQKQFITDASHELKTPLTVISASCDVVEIENGESEFTKAIKDEVTSLTELTNKLVQLSKIDEKLGEVKKCKFNLSEVLTELIDEYRIAFSNNGLNLIINIDSNIYINGDVSLIKQMNTQLIQNILKYAKNNTDVNISLEGKKLTFFNYCENIEKGNLDYLFERFYRLDKSRNRQTNSHGIGLSIVKEICNNHNANITCSSVDGQSISFVITFRG